MSEKIKAFPGQPADLDGNRVPCAYCDRAAFTRIKPARLGVSGFMTIAMVREALAKGEDVGEPRCLHHLNGEGELSLAAQREAEAAAARREQSAP